jgi:hypothetical protein
MAFSPSSTRTILMACGIESAQNSFIRMVYTWPKVLILALG